MQKELRFKRQDRRWKRLMSQKRQRRKTRARVRSTIQPRSDQQAKLDSLFNWFRRKYWGIRRETFAQLPTVVSAIRNRRLYELEGKSTLKRKRSYQLILLQDGGAIRQELDARYQRRQLNRRRGY